MQRITVTVNPDTATIADVVEELRVRGMHVDQVIELTGHVLGETDDAEPLRSVPGVVAVENETRFEIGPPDAPVQ